MSVLGRRAIDIPRALQPALPLGHADVHWDALPREVRDDVLTRWCEMLSAVVAADAAERVRAMPNADSWETRP